MQVGDPRWREKPCHTATWHGLRLSAGRQASHATRLGLNPRGQVSVTFGDLRRQQITGFRQERQHARSTLPVREGKGERVSGREDENVHLSTRQQQALAGLARGLTFREIASELDISVRTVRMHCDMLRVKLHVDRCRQAPQAYRDATGDDPVRYA